MMQRSSQLSAIRNLCVAIGVALAGSTIGMAQEFVGNHAATPDPISYTQSYQSPVCSTIGPNSPCPVRGFHCVGCASCGKHGRKGWRGAGPIPWQAFNQGEYIGPARTEHVNEYRIRVDDILDFVFRLTREPSNEPYRLDVGDIIEITALDAEEVQRQAEVQPDGTISLTYLDQVNVAGMTLTELRLDLQKRYRDYINNPTISVAPVSINAKLEELRAAVDNRYGAGGQARAARVTPEGTIQLPAIGSVMAQGLTLDELKREIEIRYGQIVSGLEVTPILQERAPRYIYVVGEVGVPGRYALEGPTTLMQAVALAGGWNVGANLNKVVVFRRDENWKLMATKLDIFSALYGKTPCPADEIWLRDSDIILVPKRGILVADELIELTFTRGLYSIVPVLYQNQLTVF